MPKILNDGCPVCKNTGRHDEYCPNQPGAFPKTSADIAETVIRNHAIKPEWVRTGEQIRALLEEAASIALGVSAPLHVQHSRAVTTGEPCACGCGLNHKPTLKARPLRPKRRYGVATDYEWSATHKRQRITVWSGSFYSTYEAEGLSLPNGAGFMLSIYDDGEKVRVSCPSPRTDDNYREVDAAIAAALADHYKEMN